MYDTASKVTGNSRIGIAIGYTIPLLIRLSRYTKNARYRIDDNLVENAVRSLALGRRTSCSVAITTPLSGLQSSTHWSAPARGMVWTRTNGWKTYWLRSRNMKIRSWTCRNSFLITGKMKPTCKKMSRCLSLAA